MGSDPAEPEEKPQSGGTGGGAGGSGGSGPGQGGSSPKAPEARPAPAAQPPAPAPISPAPGSISDGVDTAHTGFFADEDLVPPLSARWSIAVAPRQVLAADGRVYVLVDAGVAALDQASGRQLWAVALAAPPGGAGWDAGALYVASGDEIVALDGASGAVRWRKALGAGAAPRLPVAGGGAVYVVRGNNDVQALKTSDGGELWRKPGPPGAYAPALDNGRVFLGGGCGAAAALNRADGAQAWKRDGTCATGFAVPALFGGRLYVPSDGAVLDAGNGTVAGQMPPPRPVFVDGLAVRAAPDAVTASTLATGRQAWRQAGGLENALAVGHDLYGFRANRLTAVGAEDGRVLWSDGRTVDPAGRSLAVAPGLLFAAGAGRLVAYQSALRPPPRAIAVGVDRDEVAAGTTFSLVGLLGRELRGRDVRVRVEGSDWPRGRFGRVAVERAARDGGFLSGVTLYRSSRFRVRTGAAESAEVVVYAVPRVKLGSPRRAGRDRMAVQVQVQTPRTRLAGLRFFLYLKKAGSRRLERVGGARLRRAGPGRTKARLRFRPLPRTTGGDTLAFCVQRQLRLGLGKPSPLTRRCGAKRLPA